MKQYTEALVLENIHKSTNAVWAAPFALGCLLHLWIETHQVISPRTCVTQNNFATLLAHLTVILMISLLKNEIKTSDKITGQNETKLNERKPGKKY